MKPFNLSQHLTRNEVNAKDFGAIGDGVADDRAALVAADALGAFMLPTGLYKIGSNLTLAHQVRFENGARLVIPAGVSVTFNSGIEAGQYQIFNMGATSSVLGLSDAWFEWFANDLKTKRGVLPSVDCRLYLDKLAAALDVGSDYPVFGGSTARFGPGNWAISGAAASLFRGTSLYGAGSSMTGFHFLTSVTNLIELRLNRGQVRGFQTHMLTVGTYPTAGTVILNKARNCVFTDVILNECYDGWDVPSSASANTYLNCSVFGAVHYGRKVNAQEQHFHDCHVVCTEDWATITTLTGSFNFGNNVSMAGTTGTITQVLGGGRYRIVWFGNRPVNGSAITNSSVAGTGTLTLNNPAHQGAAVYWYTLAGDAQCGNVTDDGDIIGGDWGLVVQGGGAAISVTNNPAWCRTEPNFCSDTTYYGNKVDKAYGCDFHGWFSSTQNKDSIGLQITNSRRIRLPSSKHVNCAGYGLWLDNTNYQVQVTDPMFDGNAYNYTSVAGSMAELGLIASLIHDVTIIGGVMGYDDLFGRTPIRGLYIGKADGTAGGQATRVIFQGINVADGKAGINAIQINGTNQRLRIMGCQNLTDQ